MITPAHNPQGVVYTLHIRKRVFPVTTQKVPEVTYETQNASLLGNVLMGLGLVVMVVGVGYSILNQLPQFNMPQYFAHGAVLSIFVGAILWLAGARVGGHEQVCDRYWWVRHYDKRCRRSDNRRHS